LQESVIIVIFRALTELPAFCGSSSRIGSLRRGRLSIVLNFICIHTIRFFSL
jgi:hypothetical protein